MVQGEAILSANQKLSFLHNVNKWLNCICIVFSCLPSNHVVFSNEVDDTTVCIQFLVHNWLRAVVKIILATNGLFDIWFVDIETVAINLRRNFKNYSFLCRQVLK